MVVTEILGSGTHVIVGPEFNKLLTDKPASNLKKKKQTFELNDVLDVDNIYNVETVQ